MKQYQIARPFITDKDKKSVLEVLNSTKLSLGPKYIEFESNMKKYVGSKYACAVVNGTCGLHLAVKALGLKEDDEVVTSPFSFISSSNCLLYERIKPVFVDIEEETYNIDPSKIERAITKKTKAILAVHIFGQTASMDPIIKLAKNYKLKIIEDACESLGAKYKNKMAGTFGDIGVYAFYPNKQMTTGEGGMIVTSQRKIYDLCCSLRNQGRNKDGNWLIHERLGYNYRMDEMSAALGVSQLIKLDWMINQKQQIAKWYTQELSTCPNVILPSMASARIHSWFIYVIRILNRKRNALMKKLSYEQIQTKPYLPVIHLQPFMRKLFQYRTGDYPVAEKIAAQTLALPFYIGLSQNDVRRICCKIKSLL